MSTDPAVEALLRELAPQVLAAVLRRYDRFDLAEDAVQEALLAAAVRWSERGIPEHPRGWLVRVAFRRLTDAWRSEQARRRREETAVTLIPPDELLEPPADAERPSDEDALTLLFLCCHPALTAPSQVALTLRAVGGLTTAQIARAFLVPESTMGQRISRAKARIRETGVPFRSPPEGERPQRLGVVLQVLYLIFNEGHTASDGPELQRAALADEALRLARQVHRLLPDEGEVAGLLALLLLTHARGPARTAPDGALVPLGEQDRSHWDSAAISEGVALLTDTLAAHPPLGPYQLQAAIAAVHAEARQPADTDWQQILRLYDLLWAVAPSPVVALNRVVAVAMVHGPQTALAQLDRIDGEGSHAPTHRVEAVRAHLLDMAGEHAAARDGYRLAAAATASVPEQRYLTARADRLAPGGVSAAPRPG